MSKKMNLLSGIWMLVAVGIISCQDGTSQDHFRLQNHSTNEDWDSHREFGRNAHSISSLSDYQTKDEQERLNEEEHRSGTARSDTRRKIFHVRNPFERQLGQNDREFLGDYIIRDGETGASDQYAAMQYSLPPEEFLQRMRLENQYAQQQIPTSSPVGYTATPQPQLQYPSAPQNYYNSNQVSHLDQRSLDIQNYQSPSNYASPASYSYSSAQSTQSPVSNYYSTVLPDSQYIGSSANSQPYVSSAASAYLSSAPNIQQYDSSPVSTLQSNDYNNHLTTPSNTFAYGNSDGNKILQIHHYDNSVNGVRHPMGIQYQNEVSSTTLATPVNSVYSDLTREAWQNAIGANSLSKSIQQIDAISQYQKQIQNTAQESRSLSGPDNTETHRMGNLASANNVVMNFAQPGYSASYDSRSRTKDSEQVGSQPEQYSHGDYGWKLSGQNQLSDSNSYLASSYGQLSPQTLTFNPDSPKSSIEFQGDLYHLKTSYQPQQTGFDNSENSRTFSDNQDGKEFARAAAKAHENMKQQAAKISEAYYNQHYGQNQGSNAIVTQHSSNSQPNVVSTYYGNNNIKSKPTKYIIDTSNSNSYQFNHEHSDLITTSPFYYSNTGETVDSKSKQPFDHMKALKNIVSIDESNVLESPGTKQASIGNSNFDIQNFHKDLYFNKPLTDSYYRDKNSGYGFNIRTKPEDTVNADEIKSLQHSIATYGKQYQNQNLALNHALYSDKRTTENVNPQNGFISQATNVYQENVRPPTNIQQAIQRVQNQDLNNLLKLNDIPSKLTQGLSTDALRLHNSNFDQGHIPHPIPGRINQNVDNHQIDVTNSLFSKMLLNNKQIGLPYTRTNEVDPQTGSIISTINGFKVANPFNVDLRLVSDMLKGKPAVDDTKMTLLREYLNKPVPLKLDMSTLQQILLKNDDYAHLKPYDISSLSNGATIVGNPFIDIYSNRYPYQNGIKYSRSQEEEESLVPLAESTNAHPIGAVIEQDDSSNQEIPGVTDLTRQNEDVGRQPETNFEHRPKNVLTRNSKEHRGYRHPNSFTARPGHHRKHPKSITVQEPYPLLKPPPPNNRETSKRLNYNKREKRGRRRRIPSKNQRMMKTEPLFESDAPADVESESPPILLRPPPVAEDKSDITSE